MVTVYHSSVVAGDIWQMVMLCAGKAHAQLHVARSQLPMRVRALVGASCRLFQCGHIVC